MSFRVERFPELTVIPFFAELKYKLLGGPQFTPLGEGKGGGGLEVLAN
jgi:hypothetical protein